MSKTMPVATVSQLIRTILIDAKKVHIIKISIMVSVSHPTSIKETFANKKFQPSSKKMGMFTICLNTLWVLQKVNRQLIIQKCK